MRLHRAFTTTTATRSLPRTIVFLGPPGVGKGTYAARLARMLQAPHVVAGDLIRHEIDSRTELGVSVEKDIAAGHMLKDATIFKLIANRMGQPDVAETGAVLDGYPRSVDQAKRLQDIAEVEVVVNLAMREDALIAKLLGRCTCANCGRGYNTASVNLGPSVARQLPPVILKPLAPPGGRCETCGCPRMVQRSDDNAETIATRLRAHWGQCKPVEEHYRKNGFSRVVDFEITAGIPETLPHLVHAVCATGYVSVGAGGEKVLAKLTG